MGTRLQTLICDSSCRNYVLIDLVQWHIECECHRFKPPQSPNVLCPKILADRRITILVNPLADNADASIHADSTSIQLWLMKGIRIHENSIQQTLQATIGYSSHDPRNRFMRNGRKCFAGRGRSSPRASIDNGITSAFNQLPCNSVVVFCPVATCTQSFSQSRKRMRVRD